MSEQNSLEHKSEHKRLSIITDILLLIPFVVATFIFLKSVKIPLNNEASSEVLSLETEVLSIEDENELLIRNIKNDFGINVLYGKDVAPFAKRLEATEQDNKYIINNNLKVIYDALDKYPKEVFNMTLSKENPTYIMLVDHFDNNNLALASRNNLDEYRIYVSNTEKLERAFHHEMYHVIEYYMNKKEGFLYENWNKLNPNNFRYTEDTSKIDKKYVYNEEDMQKAMSLDNDYYFVTRYSKATEKEDRAEIFAELMIMDVKQNYLNKGQKIRNKVDYIFETIEENITDNDFYCSKYLK